MPYRIAEAASLGPGIIYHRPFRGGKIRWKQNLYLSAILLGGTLSDYYKWIMRDYNMGLGYSIKSITDIKLGSYGKFMLFL